MSVRLTVNGTVRDLAADPATPLLYALRGELALNGAKYGCGVGQCGACTVLSNGQPIRSCLIPIGRLAGRSITTVEGLADGATLHPLQQAFLDEQAGQCGYCIAGMIMTAAGLLGENHRPDEAAIRTALSANLCRCGSHNRIVRAVLRVVQAGA